MTTRGVLADVPVLLGFLAACFASAGLGLLFTGSVRSEWFEHLAKPWFYPPSWIFSPVWTVLYAMMAVAAFLVWRRRGAAKVMLPLVLFFVQLVLNACWTPVFFGLHNIPLSVWIIIPLLVLIALTMLAFFRVSIVAGILFVPYLAWVTFATVLNVAIWRMN